jgi:hypothetical protein
MIRFTDEEWDDVRAEALVLGIPAAELVRRATKNEIKRNRRRGK